MDARTDRLWFGALTRVLDVGVVLLGPTGEIDFANRSASALLGFADPAELAARWAEISGHFDAALEQLAAGERVPPWVAFEVGEATQARRLRAEIYRVDEEDCDGYLILVKDRDLLEALERDLSVAIQMRGLARFYVTAAHDLKAPLNAMVLNLDLLRESLRGGTGADAGADAGAAPPARDRQVRYLEVIKAEIERLNRSLEALLTQTPYASARRQAFDVRQLLEELIALLAVQAKEQAVEVAMQLPDEPVRLLAPRDRMKQAMLNIAMNALEAMPTGGRLVISLDTQDGMATVSVRDSGAGIPPDMLEQIYAMHFTTKDGGTGIGLYVARAVVEAQGGELRVESEVGRGTVVHVTLPLAAGEG